MSRSFTTHEIAAISENFRYSRHEQRNRAIFVCQMYIGARISDILALTVGDVYDQEELRYNVLISESKTKKLKDVQIVAEFRRMLNNWVLQRIDCGATMKSPLFVSDRGGQLSYNSYQESLKSACRASGISARPGEIGTHSVRKWYGNEILRQLEESGVSTIDALQTVRKLYNHSSLATTTRYLGLDQEQTQQASTMLAQTNYTGQ